MAAAISKRCSSTSPAAPAKPGRPRNESAVVRANAALHCDLAAPRVRDGAAALVSAQLVVAAPARSDVLARGADADVGLSADVRLAECRLARHACRRHIH